MKISNETKIGALAAVSIAVLILGFNYLKGQNLFEQNARIYSVFAKTDGLNVSNPVTINGLPIGKVASMHERDKNMSAIIVAIDLTKDINIPDNSLVFVNKELLGSPSLVIKMGNNTTYLKDGDTIQTTYKPDVFENVQASINPAINNLNSAIQSLEVLIANVNSIFDPRTKNNFQTVIANLAASAASLRTLLNAETGMLAQTLDNLNTFTVNLNKNNDQLNRTVSNLETATSKLAKADIEKVIKGLEDAVNNLNTVTAKINSKDGSLGLLLNDKKLYTNLENSARSLNILLDDLRVNPKRYVNISLIGRKNKGGYLEAPLIDTTKRP
ncbi:MAG TPA: MlaD family protein [Chitinophagaceae bacterium]|nr:MlaD family protein [Chitinophagaceae bacterium]